MSTGTSGSRPGLDFTLEPREGYLYLHLAPGFEATPESMARIWTAISDACRRNNLRRVLADGESVQRRLTPMESYDHAALAARLMPGLSVACCFRGYQTDEQTEFFRTAAMNRGVRVEFFADLEAALRWLGTGT
ncbi:MAG TPA: hypothetical protein VFR29_00790 [Steroidobacteraceae bacterium]|nr:hypothetical protein [Steroidobacteraceae bacterium]